MNRMTFVGEEMSRQNDHLADELGRFREELRITARSAGKLDHLSFREHIRSAHFMANLERVALTGCGAFFRSVGYRQLP
jgi:hypothetical protein